MSATFETALLSTETICPLNLTRSPAIFWASSLIQVDTSTRRVTAILSINDNDATSYSQGQRPGSLRGMQFAGSVLRTVVH
eukprot:scaffold7350_cov233-Pinguiococcus_pyrenoidosus.AAC.5